jgi:hypothetical protein
LTVLLARSNDASWVLRSSALLAEPPQMLMPKMLTPPRAAIVLLKCVSSELARASLTVIS